MQKTINARHYEQLVTVFLQVQQTLVGIDHLLEVNRFINHMHK